MKLTAQQAADRIGIGRDYVLRQVDRDEDIAEEWGAHVGW
jgi:hypothetical protein